MSARRSVANYIQAKDQNRPHLMRAAFAEDATVKMVVKTGVIAFPPVLSGREAISDALVRRFGETCENVYTFCLTDEPPPAGAGNFSCGWLVGMSSKEDGTVRVGCGRYDWVFGGDARRLAAHLTITIEEMVVLPRPELHPVMDWLSALPQIWCDAGNLWANAHAHPELSPVMDYCSQWQTQQRRRFS